MKIALITGATSGIGEATAYILASRGYNLILTGRRRERLESLAINIKNEYKVQIHLLCFDIREKEMVQSSINSLPQEWKAIDVLINNAGLAVGLGHIQDGNIEDWERMIDTNVKGLLYITRVVAPLIIEQGRGDIINIGSIAGKEVYENGNVYCATKHAVDALTKAMRIDMLKEGIRVTGVCPGAVETEFSLVRFNGDPERAAKVYENIEPLYAQDIAEIIAFIVSLPPRVCINDILVMPTVQANATQFNRSLT